MSGKQAKVMSTRDQRRLLAVACRGRLPERDRVIVLLALRAGLRARVSIDVSKDTKRHRSAGSSKTSRPQERKDAYEVSDR